jgi:hypothetical protein
MLTCSACDSKKDTYSNMKTLIKRGQKEYRKVSFREFIETAEAAEFYVDFKNVNLPL